jgi:hypothetical protein
MQIKNKPVSTTIMDSVVSAVIEKFKGRAEVGMKKYGVNLDRKDLSVLEWIQHAQEEHMDAILYLEKLKQIETERASADTIETKHIRFK